MGIFESFWEFTQTQRATGDRSWSQNIVCAVLGGPSSFWKITREPMFDWVGPTLGRLKCVERPLCCAPGLIKAAHWGQAGGAGVFTKHYRECAHDTWHSHKCVTTELNGLVSWCCMASQKIPRIIYFCVEITSEGQGGWACITPGHPARSHQPYIHSIQPAQSLQARTTPQTLAVYRMAKPSPALSPNTPLPDARLHPSAPSTPLMS